MVAFLASSARIVDSDYLMNTVRADSSDASLPGFAYFWALPDDEPSDGKDHGKEKNESKEEPVSETVEAEVHSDKALKLRVANGKLTTVLSPFGDQLTSVDLTMEVIQRSSLSIGLPANGELFSIFVNGESVHSVRQGDTWQFYILPGANDRTANVKFFYSVPGEKLSHVDLTSPQLDVPLENIEWSVVAPKGFELTDDGGNLKLKQQQNWSRFDKSSYLNKASGQRREQAQKAKRAARKK